MARKRKQASLNKPQKEAAIVESAAKSPGAEIRPDSEVKQKADSTVNKSTAASADEIPGARKDLQGRFGKSHKFIKERIVTVTPPEEILDIREQFQDGHLALGDYVTLDWQHCEEIYSLMAAIHEY